MKAVVLLSGGLDSTVTLAQAVKNHHGDVGAISFTYGQKHVAPELAAAVRIAEMYSVHHKIISLDASLFTGAGSALMGETKMPELSYEQLRNAEGPSPTYVPFRNANLISQAVAFALSRGAEFVYYGAHAEDARNFAYPDCTPEFNGALAAAIYIGTYHKVRLVTPLQNFSKAGVVSLGVHLRVPLHLTWSCYNGGDIQCGKCPTCIGRKEAFKSAGYNDSTVYLE